METYDEYTIAAWIQPTSPFIQTQTIDDCLRVLKTQKYYKSVQTITEVPHNHHAWNQRILGDVSVQFLFENKRLKAYNKQKKPDYYVFGNFVAVKTYQIESNIFRPHSKGIVIPRVEALDVDGPEDLEIARFYAKKYYGAGLKFWKDIDPNVTGKKLILHSPIDLIVASYVAVKARDPLIIPFKFLCLLFRNVGYVSSSPRLLSKIEKDEVHARRYSKFQRN